MTILLICLCVIAALMAMGYLADSAVAGRWLPLREWLARTTCNHTHGRLVAIEFDGESVYECARCGKLIGKPLRIGAGSVEPNPLIGVVIMILAVLYVVALVYGAN